MASTQTEAEVPRNGPEIKELDGPSTNGVDGQTDMDTSTTNGPNSTTTGNNGSHDMSNPNNLGYYKTPPSGYDPSASYENSQSGFGYPPHRYPHHQSDMQGSYPFSQYPGGQNVVRSVSTPVATKPAAYMNSMPRTGGPGLGYPVHGGQGYPPSRYPTPTLNQLLQPGSGPPVQRYPYGDYSQQQPPTSQAAGWPMQQPRNYNPGVGFKPPANSAQVILCCLDKLTKKPFKSVSLQLAGEILTLILLNWGPFPGYLSKPFTPRSLLTCNETNAAFITLCFLHSA